MSETNATGMKEKRGKVTEGPPRQEPAPAQEKVLLPEGFEPVSIEAVGAWTGLKAIYVRPVGYTLSDSKPMSGDQVRVNAVLICRAVVPVEVFRFGAEQKGVASMAAVGDYIAIFYKPGLRDVLKCGGVTTFIAPAGERKLEGRGDPMKLFTVATKGGVKGKELGLLQDKDFRIETRSWPLPWEKQNLERPWQRNEEFNGGWGDDEPHF